MEAKPDALLRTSALGRIKMRYLLLLVAIDDMRSVHKAAEVMHITQPAATKLLAELERLVGVRLFDRTTRGLTPTNFGESLVAHARTIVASLGHAWDDLAALRAGASGRVNVGAIVAAEAVLLPAAIVRLKQRYPNLAVSIKGGTFDSLIPELRAGTLDLAVARWSADRDSAGIRYEPLYEEPMRLLGRANHPLNQGKKLSLATLAAYPWIWPPQGSIYRSRLDAMFRRAEVAPPKDIVESECTLVNTALIKNSDRIGALPLTVVRSLAAGDGLVTLPVDLPAPSGMLAIMCPSDRDLSLGAEALAVVLRETAVDISEGMSNE